MSDVEAPPVKPPQTLILTKVPTDPLVERSLVPQTYMRGPAALFELGYTEAAVAEFIQRPHVLDAFAALGAEQRHEEVLLGRARFIAKRTMAGMIPDAVDLMRQALNGPVYARDENGYIINDKRGNPIMNQRVDTSQFAAAVEILNRVGVNPKEPATQDVNPTVLFASQADARRSLVDQSANLTEEQRIISRERMRSIVSVLSPKIAEIKAQILKTAPQVIKASKPKPAATSKGPVITKPAPKSKPKTSSKH